jgi:hypothetical protein
VNVEDAPQAAQPLTECTTPAGGRVPPVRTNPRAPASSMFEAVEPWPTPVDGAVLFTRVAEVFNDYAKLPPHADIALALWTGFTYVHEQFQTCPMMILNSPEKGCGKTTVVELVGLLCNRPMPASNISASALFRCIEREHPTMLLDEADSFVRNNEDLRGIINSGHTRATAFIWRSVGKDFIPTRFETWSPKLIAGIGTLADTIMSRGVVVTLRRKMEGETIKRARHGGPFVELRRMLARWAEDNREHLSKVIPHIPPQLENRAADNWEVLLAIATLCGGAVLTQAEKAAVELSARADSDGESWKTWMLQDFRDIFDGVDIGDRITSEQAVQYLNAMDDRPWPEACKGKPLTKMFMAKLLKPFGITPQTIRPPSGAGRTLKGYYRSQFELEWARYLKPANVEASRERLAGMSPIDTSHF